MTAPKDRKKQPPNSGTITDPEEARRRQAAAVAARRRKVAARAAAKAAAEAAANDAPNDADPDPPPASPQTVAERTKAAALAAAARTIPASARIRIERIFPSWCAGYLETIDAAIIADTGLDDYLRETWGGERFKVTVRDNGKDLWTAADAKIAGRPRWFGTEIQPPRPIQYRPDFADPDAPARPPAPYQPPPPAVDPNVSALAVAVADLTQTTGAILRRLDAGAPAANAQGTGANPGLGGVIDAIDTAVAVKRKLDGLAPPPPPAPEPREDSGRSAVGDKIAERLAEKGIDLLFENDKKAHNAPEAAPVRTANPPAAEDAEPDIPRAERVN